MKVFCTLASLVLLLSVVTLTVAQEGNVLFLPSDLEVITDENAHRLHELARLGAGSINSLVWSPDSQYIVAFGASGAWLFNRNNISEPEAHIQNHSERVEYAAFSPDSKLIATGSDDVVIVTSVDTGEPLHTLKTASGFAAFSSDGTWLVTDSRRDSGSPIIWSISTGEMITELERNQQAYFTGVAFSQDGSQMAGVYNSGRWPYMNAIKVWNTITWEELINISTGWPRIRSVSFSNAHPHLMTCTENETFAWSLENGNLVESDHENIECAFKADVSTTLASFGINSAEVYGEVLSPDQLSIAFIDADGHIQIGNLSTLRRQVSNFAFSRSVSDLAFSPNGRVLAVLEGRPDGTASVRLWDLVSAPVSTVTTLTLENYYIYTSQLTFLSNDELLIYDSRTGQVGILNTVSEEFTVDFQIEINGRGVLAISSDFNNIVYIDWQAGVSDIPLLHMQTSDIASNTVFNISSNPGSYEYTPPIIWKAVYSPGGDFIATAGRAAHLWNSQTGEEVAVFYDYTFPEGQWEIDDVVFSPDGRFLAAGTKEWNSQLYVWDVQRAIETYPITLQDPMTDTGSLVTQLSHVSSLLVFSPDGKLLVSGAHGLFWSGDSTIKIWNTSHWEQVVVLSGHVDGISSFDFMSDGTLLASAGLDGTIRLWGVVE